MSTPSNKLSKIGTNLRGDNSAIRTQRADRVSQQIKLRQDSLVQELELKLLDLESQLDSVMDTGPEHTTSLRVVPPDFDPEEFVTQIHELSKEIHLARVELDIAKTNREQLFEQKIEPVTEPSTPTS